MTDLEKYELLFDLTAHPGWKVLSKDAEDAIEYHKNDVFRERSSYEQGIMVGEVSVYNRVINLREYARHLIDVIKEQEDEQAASL